MHCTSNCDFLAIHRLLIDYGTKLHSISEPIGDSPAEKLFETTLAGFSDMALYPGTYHTDGAVIPPVEHLTTFVRNISTRMEHGNIIRHWKTVLTELIKEYNPKTLILPKIDDSNKRRSGRLKRMMASLKKLAKKYWIKVIEIILTTVYGNPDTPLLPKTKARLVPIVASHHSSLKHYELRVKKREVEESKPYFLRLFMAVALGMTYQFQQVRR